MGFGLSHHKVDDTLGGRTTGGLFNNSDHPTTLTCRPVKKHWQYNTFVTESAVDFKTVGHANESKRVKIKINGVCVLRIGLSSCKPGTSEENFKEVSVFEHELGKSDDDDKPYEMVLYRNRFGHIGLHHPDKERVYRLKEKSPEQMWVYIMVIYGSPSVDVKDEADNYLRMLRLDNDEDVTGKSPLSVKQYSVTTYLKDPIRDDWVYHMKWHMTLTNENIAGRQPRFGLFTFGFASTVNDLDNISENGFEISSAVNASNHTDVIAFKLRKHLAGSDEVIHNLLENPAGNTSTRPLPGNFFSSPQYLYIKISSGSLSVEHDHEKKPKKSGLTVKQEPSPTYLFENVQNIRSVAKLRNDIQSATTVQPRSIQFGPSPLKFILKLGIRSEEKMQLCASNLRRNYGQDVTYSLMQPTKTIQIHGVTEEISFEKMRYSLRQYFSNPDNGGGDCEYPNKERKGCWKLTFEKLEDVSSVLAEDSHFVNGYQVHVLPFYTELDMAIDKKGSLPTFDLEPFTIQLKNLREHIALQLFKKFPDEADRFQKNLECKGFHVELSPKEMETYEESSDSEGESDDDENAEARVNVTNVDSIKVHCKISPTEHSRLVDWKTCAKEAVDNFFVDSVSFKDLHVSQEHFESALIFLDNKAQDGLKFCFKQQEREQIALLSTDHTILTTLEEGIEILAKQKQQKYPHTIPDTKFKILRAEGHIESMQQRYPNTSFGTENLHGPEEEILQAIEEIQNLSMTVISISVEITKSQSDVLLSNVGKGEMERTLKENKLSTQFDVEPSYLQIDITSENDKAMEAKKTNITTLINTVVHTENVSVKPADAHKLRDDKWGQFIERHRKTNDDVFTIFSDSLRVTATRTSVQRFKVEFNAYLQERDQLSITDKFPISHLEFVQTFSKNDHSNVTFSADNGRLDGKITYVGKLNEIEKIKTNFKKEIENVETKCIYVRFPWAAKVAGDIPSYQTDHHCVVKVDTANSLAENGIKAEAIHETSCAIIIAKRCNIARETVDVIVSPSDTELSFHGTTGKYIRNMAGHGMYDDLMKKTNGKSMHPGEVIVSEPGRLRCMKIFHAVQETDWTSGHKNGVDKLIEKCLDNAGNIKASSIAFAAMWVEDTYLDEKAKLFIETVGKYLSAHPKSTVKEVYFCDNGPSLDEVVMSMRNLDNRNWFVFKHDLQLQNEHDNHGAIPKQVQSEKDNPKSTEQTQQRPKTAKRFGRSMPAAKSEQPNGERADQTKSSSKQNMRDKSPDIGLQQGDARLTVVHGDITQQNSDVVVSTAGQFPKIVGAVAKAIVQRGGQEIADACNTIGSINPGDVAETTAGSLSCKRLFHVLLKKWDENDGVAFVEGLIRSCLAKASDKGYKSISFPGIGTGQFNYPQRTVARAIAEGWQAFKATHPDSPLQEVRVVIFEDKTLQIFNEIVSTKVGTSGSQREEMRDETEQPITVTFNERREAAYVPPRKPRDRSGQDDVVIIQLVQAKGEDRFKDLLSTVHSELIREETIDIGKITRLENLEPNEIKKLEDCSIVGCSVDATGTSKVVSLKGCKRDVQNTVFKVNELLTEINLRRQDLQFYEKLMESVTWFYLKGEKPEKFSVESNWKLEDGYSQSSSVPREFQYEKGREKYVVKVKADGEITGYNMKNAADTKKLMRQYKMDEGIQLPIQWTIVNSRQMFNKVLLNQTDGEFNEVKKKFLETATANQKRTFVHIYRIENRFLWDKYHIKKKEIEGRNDRKDNERMLWHGTGATTADIIYKTGYDRSFTTVAAYGLGVYFARNASYSESDRYSPPDPNNGNIKTMFLNRVLTGDYEKGNNKMHVLNMRDQAKKIPFDSAADSTGPDPEVFVIFHDSQVYPEYMVEFKHS